MIIICSDHLSNSLNCPLPRFARYSGSGIPLQSVPNAHKTKPITCGQYNVYHGHILLLFTCVFSFVFLYRYECECTQRLFCMMIWLRLDEQNTQYKRCGDVHVLNDWSWKLIVAIELTDWQCAVMRSSRSRVENMIASHRCDAVAINWLRIITYKWHGWMVSIRHDIKWYRHYLSRSSGGRQTKKQCLLVFCFFFCCARDGAISGATFCTEDIIIMTILITITPKLIVFIFYVSSLLLARVGIGMRRSFVSISVMPSASWTLKM